MCWCKGLSYFRVVNHLCFHNILIYASAYIKFKLKTSKILKGKLWKNIVNELHNLVSDFANGQPSPMHDFRLFSAHAKSVWFILVSRILLVDGGDQFDLPRSSRKSSRWDVRMSHSGAIYLKYTYVFLPHLIFVIEINRRLNINSSIDGDDTLLEEIRTVRGKMSYFYTHATKYTCI